MCPDFACFAIETSSKSSSERCEDAFLNSRSTPSSARPSVNGIKVDLIGGS